MTEQIGPTSVGSVMDTCLNWLRVPVCSAVKYTFNSTNFTRIGMLFTKLSFYNFICYYMSRKVGHSVGRT
jgi:hypothetical protein